MSHDRVRQIVSTIDLESLRRINADELLDFDFGRNVRGEADRRKRSDRPIVCAKCEHPVIVPMHWRTREYYFRHFQRDVKCPWTSTEERISVDEANARIFLGQQEGKLHQRLKQILGSLIESLPNVTACWVDQRYTNAKGDYRKPDVRFEIHGKIFVLEIQLATTHRSTITERNQFYISEGFEIIWITWNPARSQLSAYKACFIDIITDHNDNLFSVDDETFALSRSSGELKFRVNWWEDSVCRERLIGLNEIVFREGRLPYAVAKPPTWSENFKDKWFEAGDHKSIPTLELRKLWEELVAHLDYGLDYKMELDWDIAAMISLLISLDRGTPVDSKQKNLTEVLHTFLTTKGRKPMARIAKFAIIATGRSNMLDRPKTRELLDAAMEEVQAPKFSIAAAVARLLFPNWLGRASDGTAG